MANTINALFRYLQPLTDRILLESLDQAQLLIGPQLQQLSSSWLNLCWCNGRQSRQQYQ
jgi:hypothetical protein